MLLANRKQLSPAVRALREFLMKRMQALSAGRQSWA
jgi:hypothetical protein